LACQAAPPNEPQEPLPSPGEPEDDFEAEAEEVYDDVEDEDIDEEFENLDVDEHLADDMDEDEDNDPWVLQITLQKGRPSCFSL